MQKRHKDRKQYFKEQGITTKEYVIPYVEDTFPLEPAARVLEIGCGEGGNIGPFLERGFEVVGVDLNERQINNAREYLEEFYPDSNYKLILEDIYKIDIEEIGKFDLIFMRDVIEHIHNQERFLKFLKKFMKPTGRVFFGFPPWRMPFGGHQQICKNKFLSKLPFFHLLPMPLFKMVLKVFGETNGIIDSLVEIKETGISINRFERIINQEGYTFEKKDLYFINPNYKVKFGLTPRKLYKFIGAIPFVRDFFTTCYYCQIKLSENN